MKADPQRIHQLEHELGFRDDPPPAVWTDEPGAVIPYYPTTHEQKVAYMMAKAEIWSKRLT